jgi:hypothetical protein
VADHRHNEAVIGLGGDADIDVLVTIDDALLVIITGIDLWKSGSASTSARIRTEAW